MRCDWKIRSIFLKMNLLEQMRRALYPFKPSYPIILTTFRSRSGSPLPRVSLVALSWWPRCPESISFDFGEEPEVTWSAQGIRRRDAPQCLSLPFYWVARSSSDIYCIFITPHGDTKKGDSGTALGSGKSNRVKGVWSREYFKGDW